MHASHLARPGHLVVAGVIALSVLGLGGLPASASTPGADTRLTNDNGASAGYVSNFNINNPAAAVAKDNTLSECSASRGRQNEPSVAVDPRNPGVIVGSSNDYCGVYNDGVDADGELPRIDGTDYFYRDASELGEERETFESLQRNAR